MAKKKSAKSKKKPDGNSARYPLKAWDDPDWTRALGPNLVVSRVDEDIPTDEQSSQRKPWCIALTQQPGVLDKLGGVRGLPAGNTVLLSERDVMALMQYLTDPQTAVWVDNLSAAGDRQAKLFLQPGIIALTRTGFILNTEEQWSPAFFDRLKPTTKARGLKERLHTLPWPRRQPKSKAKGVVTFRVMTSMEKAITQAIRRAVGGE